MECLPDLPDDARGACAVYRCIFTASSIYQVTVAGLTPLQLVLVGTTLELSVFIFEIPTGVVADVYSRRLSIIIGMFLIGLGFLVEGTFPIFWAILLAQVLWGVGYTFTSGATEAWITDEIGEAAAGQGFPARQPGRPDRLAGRDRVGRPVGQLTNQPAHPDRRRVDRFGWGFSDPVHARNRV